MKSLDQIVRYTSQCAFPDDDWQGVLDYCREKFGGGKIHRAIQPVSPSTYGQFREWIDSGLGLGEMVGYANTMGIIGTSTPDKIVLAAYCSVKITDENTGKIEPDRLIIKDLEVTDKSKIKPLANELRQTLKRLVYEKGMDYSIRTGLFKKGYIPKKYSHVILDENNETGSGIGIYLESNGHKYHFSAFVRNGEVLMDCRIDSDYTYLKPATAKEVKKFRKAMSDAGWAYNERACKFVKMERKGRDNVYWYLNERFEIVMDKDNGAERHTARFKAGNYFLVYKDSLEFQEKIKEIIKGEI